MQLNVKHPFVQAELEAREKDRFIDDTMLLADNLAISEEGVNFPIWQGDSESITTHSIANKLKNT